MISIERDPEYEKFLDELDREREEEIQGEVCDLSDQEKREIRRHYARENIGY